MGEANKIPEGKFSTRVQLVLYLGFAGLMVVLNIGIQNTHLKFIVPWISANFGTLPLVQNYYLSTATINMPELVGSVIAVGITYIVKFLLDKFIVFRKNTQNSEVKAIGREFGIYLALAVLTTVENIGIQFLLGVFTPLPVNLRILIALTAGYLTKFFLDRKYVFTGERRE